MEMGQLVAVVGLVSAVGSWLGSMFGNRVNIAWIKEKLKEHDDKHANHQTRLNGHELAIGLLQGGKK